MSLGTRATKNGGIHEFRIISASTVYTLRTLKMLYYFTLCTPQVNIAILAL